MSEAPASQPDGEAAAISATAISATAGPEPASPLDDAHRLEQIETELTGVEAALRRLDDDTYHTCEVCGAPLDAGTLAVEPLTARCAQHLH